MIGTTSPQPGFDTPTATAHTRSGGSLHTAEADKAWLASSFGEGADRSILSWESAWVDLGGEG